MITTGGNHLQPYTQQPIAVIDFTVDGVEVLNPLALKTSYACTAGGGPTPPSYVLPVGSSS